jgi:hypothetical protein
MSERIDQQPAELFRSQVKRVLARYPGDYDAKRISNLHELTNDDMMLWEALRSLVQDSSKTTASNSGTLLDRAQDVKEKLVALKEAALPDSSRLYFVVFMIQLFSAYYSFLQTLAESKSDRTIILKKLQEMAESLN